MDLNLLATRYKYDGLPNSHCRINMIQELAIYNFLLEYDNGNYDTTTISCDCGCNDFEVIAEKDRYGLPCQTVICKNCGLVMINPRMTQDSYNRFYDKHYRIIYTGNEQASDKFFEDQYNHGVVIKNILSDFLDIKSLKNVLEIGCGAGGILKPFADEGIKVKGVDLGSSYLKYGISKGLDLENINSKELLSRNTKYDLIILSHVAEHFLDLDSEFNCICELLNDDGKIYIEVPGINNVYFGGPYNGDLLLYFQNAHVRHFSLASLRNTLSKYNLKLLAGDEQIASIFVKGSDSDIPSLSTYEDAVSRLFKTEKVYEENMKDYSSSLIESVRLEIEEEYSNKWMANLDNGKFTATYLRKLGYNNVAICGVNHLTELLISELKALKFDISYMIDSDNRTNPANLDDINIYPIDSDLPDVDIVLLAVPLESSKLRKILNKKGITNVIPFCKIILDLYSS